MRIPLKTFTDGLDHQKGAIFGFGPSATKEPNNLKFGRRKISIHNINVQVHNIAGEREVEMINYELPIRG